MNKDNKSFWALLAMFLLGIVVGFSFAPIKKGVRVKVMNNGNIYKDDGYFELDEDYDGDYESYEGSDEDYNDCDCDECEDSIQF